MPEFGLKCDGAVLILHQPMRVWGSYGFGNTVCLPIPTIVFPGHGGLFEIPAIEEVYLNYLRLVFVGALSLVMSGSAYDFMKITLADGVAEESLTEIEKVIFSDGQMTATGIYELSDIVKIEFTEASNEAKPLIGKGGANKISKISMHRVGNRCSFRVPSNSRVSIRLYSLNGRRIATLFDGIPKENEISVSLGERRLKAGIYGIVLESNAELYAWKLTEGGSAE